MDTRKNIFLTTIDESLDSEKQFDLEAAYQEAAKEDDTDFEATIADGLDIEY